MTTGTAVSVPRVGQVRVATGAEEHHRFELRFQEFPCLLSLRPHCLCANNALIGELLVDLHTFYIHVARQGSTRSSSPSCLASSSCSRAQQPLHPSSCTSCPSTCSSGAASTWMVSQDLNVSQHCLVKTAVASINLFFRRDICLEGEVKALALSIVLVTSFNCYCFDQEPPKAVAEGRGQNLSMLH